jgi:hypothetical protein
MKETPPPRHVPPAAAPAIALPDARYMHDRYRIAGGVPFGEPASITDEEGHALFHYSSFSSITGIVAALVTGIVIVAGIGASAFLLSEKLWIAAAIALALSGAFAAIIAMLVPQTEVTVFEDAAMTQPAFTMHQATRYTFPAVEFAVRAAGGRDIGHLRMSSFSRLAKHHWHILDRDGTTEIGDAVEESLPRAVVRKFLGKFSAQYESNLRIRAGWSDAGWIVRRPSELTEARVLDVTLDAGKELDRRLALALALLVIAAEP